METPSNKEIQNRERLAPIIDGDARPDIKVNPEDELNMEHPIPTPEDKKKKTTTNRVDSNSLEDFRDAK